MTLSKLNPKKIIYNILETLYIGKYFGKIILMAMSSLIPLIFLIFSVLKICQTT